jgi:hypothetical protein
VSFIYVNEIRARTVSPTHYPMCISLLHYDDLHGWWWVGLTNSDRHCHRVVVIGLDAH